MATAAVDTHSTGMLSCFKICLDYMMIDITGRQIAFKYIFASV